jgi:electron transport complex protein RnfG
MIRLTLVLALITFIAAVALGFVYESAAPKIEEQKRVTEERARRTALPGAACGVYVERDREGFVYYEGYRSADTTDFVGYVIKAAGRGYSSTIETIVGVTPAGAVAGLKITQQQETPGLGTKIQEVKTTKTVLDAIRELAGQGRPGTITVSLSAQALTLVDVLKGEATERCFEVELKNEPLCGDIEKLLVERDSAGVYRVAPEAFGLAPEDSNFVFSSAARTFALTEVVIGEIRAQATPWFLKQFLGKRSGSLIVTAEPTDRHIQAITGATISSVAVTESIQAALKDLEKAIGGFEEAGK